MRANGDKTSGGAQTDRDDVKREPLTPPKVDSATEMGMIHDITPSNFSPKVWEECQERREQEGRGRGAGAQFNHSDKKKTKNI